MDHSRQDRLCNPWRFKRHYRSPLEEDEATQLAKEAADRTIKKLQEFIDSETWDRQIEQDAACGKLDALFGQVEQSYENGELTFR